LAATLANLWLTTAKWQNFRKASQQNNTRSRTQVTNKAHTRILPRQYLPQVWLTCHAGKPIHAYGTSLVGLQIPISFFHPQHQLSKLPWTLSKSLSRGLSIFLPTSYSIASARLSRIGALPDLLRTLEHGPSCHSVPLTYGPHGS
jgi:hypothetical protein